METAEDLRFRLTLHYDGTHFFGWQIQRTERTVQGELEAALKRLTGSRRPVLGSGRTDRGVHAIGQVAAVTVPRRWQPDTLRRALNAILPADVWVQSVAPVPSDFNPRYAAVARTYRYRIGTTPEAQSPFRHPWCWSLGTDLDIETLQAAADILRGRHSFKAFAKSGQPERGEFCTIQSAIWSPWEELGLEFEIVADRYLHRMVRYLVGTMVDIGRGRRPLLDLRRLLDDPDESDPENYTAPPSTRDTKYHTRLETSPPAPPRGLFLAHVKYEAPTDGAANSPDHIPPKTEAEPA